MRGRNLDIVHSGMVLLSDGKGNGNQIARLILTKDQLAIQMASSEDQTAITVLPESSFDGTIRTVNVNRTQDGLGLSIKGGSDGTHSVPIVISKVLPNLSAAQTGQIFVGDSIVEINGISVEGKTHEEVVNMLRKSTESHVTLTLKHDSQMAPLLRPASSKHSVEDSILDVNIFKSALKSSSQQQSPDKSRQQQQMGRQQSLGTLPRNDDEFFNSDEWRTVNRIPLPMSIVSRYLWGTDKIRSNAFEVRSVDGRSSGIIHCEDRRALDQWLKYIEKHIFTLNKKSIKMSNKYLHPAERISYIGWVEERIPDGHFEDPKQKWEQRFIIFKGADLCVFESPPLNSEELDKCVCMYKVYETALKTAIKRRDRREFVFCLDTAQSAQHYFSLQSQLELQNFETSYYNCVYKSVSSIQTRTFACSCEGRPAGLVLDLAQGISLYDIPTKRYIWHYTFGELENSSDDGKMRLQLIFHEPGVKFVGSNLNAVNHFSDIKDLECDQVQFVVFTLHAFYVTKIMGADPEYLKSLPLS